MKKLITFIIVALTSLNCFSIDCTGTEIVLYKNDKPLDTKPTTGTRSAASYPCVINENGTLIITSNIFIENAHITITDNSGTIIANETTSLSKTCMYIQLPDIGDNVEYKIEIEYGDTYLYAFIN